MPQAIEAITTIIGIALLVLITVAAGWHAFQRMVSPNMEMPQRRGDGISGTAKDIRCAWTLAILEDKHREMAKQRQSLLSGKDVKTETGIAVKAAKNKKEDEWRPRGQVYPMQKRG